jgi:hypothetical protein
MMVNSDIIHLCTSLRKIFHGESIKLPEEVHHIIMLPIFMIGKTVSHYRILEKLG